MTPSNSTRGFLFLLVFLFTAIHLQAQGPPDGKMSISRTSPDTFTLGINTGALWEYGLEASDDLTLPWTPLDSVFLAGDGGRHSLRVILPQGAPRAFFRYRIRERAAGASGDALSDWDRILFFNASVLGDLDGDGFADTLETALGTNQNDALSYPWRVVRTVPYAGEEGHARDEAVLLYLNQPLPLSVTEVPVNFVRELHYLGDTALDFALNARGSTVILPGRKVVAFLPSPPLLEGSNHTLLDNYRVDFSTATTGIAQLAPWHAHFSTVATFDTVGPWVKQVLPGETAIEVATDFVPSIEWSQPLQPAAVVAANVAVVNETTSTPHAVSVVFDYDTNRMSLAHAAPFEPDTLYTVTLGAGFTNLMSKPLLHPFAWSFRTRPAALLPVAGQGPFVAASVPAAYSVDAGTGGIAITFSEPMDVATLVAANVHLREYGAASDVEGTFSYDAPTQVLSFSPLAQLRDATRHELTLDAPAILSAVTPPQALQAQMRFVFTTAAAPGSGTPGGTASADANAGTQDPEQKPPLQLAIGYGDPTGHASATVRLEITLPDGSHRQAQLPNATKQWRTELSPKVPDGSTVVVVPSHVRDDDPDYVANSSGYPESTYIEVGAASPSTAGTGYLVTHNYLNAGSTLLGALLAGPFIAQVVNGDTITVDPSMVKLQIWNGQGATTPVAQKTKVGAFTVANLNDTDGDEIPDNLYPFVLGEKDLMKLNLSGYKNLTGKAKLTIKGGSVKFYESSEKITEIPLTNGTALFDIPVAGLSKTIWIEATAASTTVRDIVIEAGHQDGQGNSKDGLDTVKATAVWATLTGTKNQTNDVLWADVEDPMRDTFINDYQKFGLNLNNPGGTALNVIGFEFTVQPPNIGKEPGVLFDITRQRKSRAWTIAADIVGSLPVDGFPNTPGQPDLANDDGRFDDESNSPKNNHIYVFDGPGVTIAGINPDVNQQVLRANFKEYVRVSFNGDPPVGNTDDGSRCSPKHDWHFRMWIEKVGGIWRERIGKPNVIQGGAVIFDNTDPTP